MRRFFRIAISGVSIVLVLACSPNSLEPETNSKPGSTETTARALMTWADLTGRPLPKPSAEIKTGKQKNDVIDLWVPDGEGPHPVVIMVHGGCWQKSIADRTLMNYAAEELRRNGMAVWNIEYRGVDEKGGGYPGTFLDVAAAADALGDHAQAYNLDLGRIAATGHSAGGHLALWLAARHKISSDSPLYSETALRIPTVLNVGGLADLEDSMSVTLPSCLEAILPKLTGEPSEQRPNVFSDTSPALLLPFDTHQIHVNGSQDRIAPPALGKAYMGKALERGDLSEFIEIDNTGHVELIAPGTRAFDIQVAYLRRVHGIEPKKN